MYEPIKPQDLPPRMSGSMTKMVNADLDNFMEESVLAARVRVPEGVNRHRLCKTYKMAIEKRGLTADAYVAKGQLYLVKKKRAAARATNTDDSKPG